MKYLQNYIEDNQTELFRKTRSFFAFGQKQFDEAKEEGMTYVNCGAGLLCPKENVKELLEGLDEIYKNGIAEDIKENGKEAIIKRELYNHEAFYTCEIEATYEALKSYEFTLEEIQEVFSSERHLANQE